MFRLRRRTATDREAVVSWIPDAAMRTYESAGFATSPRSDRPDVREMFRAL